MLESVSIYTNKILREKKLSKSVKITQVKEKHIEAIMYVL